MSRYTLTLHTAPQLLSFTLHPYSSVKKWWSVTNTQKLGNRKGANKRNCGVSHLWIYEFSFSTHTQMAWLLPHLPNCLKLFLIQRAQVCCRAIIHWISGIISGGTIKNSPEGQWSNTFGFEICKSTIHGCNIHTSTLAGSETVAGRNAIIIVGWSTIAPVEISPLEVKVLPARVEMPLQQEDALSLHHLFWWKRYHRACSDIWIISAERKRRCTAYENNF